MADEKPEKQKTAKGLEIPIPTREEIEGNLRKLVQPMSVDAWMSEALAFVPKGDLCQGQFRATLNMALRNALGSQPEHPEWTVAQVVEEAVKRLDCNPQFDPALLALTWPNR